MTPTTRLLSLLAADHDLIRGPGGWRVVVGASFERVDTAAVKEALAAGWVAPKPGTPSGIVWVLTDAGRTELEGEECDDHT